MAKTKQTKKMIAMALAAAVVMSSMPVVAFAEDGQNVENNGGGDTPAPANETKSAPSVQDGTAMDAKVAVTPDNPDTKKDEGVKQTTVETEDGKKVTVTVEAVGSAEGTSNVVEDAVNSETGAKEGTEMVYKDTYINGGPSSKGPYLGESVKEAYKDNEKFDVDEFLPGTDVYDGNVKNFEGNSDDKYDYELVTQTGSSQYRPLGVYTEPMSYETKLDYFGYGACISPDNVDNLSEAQKAQLVQNEDGSYATKDGYLVDKDGKFITEEETSYELDGKVYYTHRLQPGKMNINGGYIDGEKTNETFYGVWEEAAQYVMIDKVTGELFTVYSEDYFVKKWHAGDGYTKMELEDMYDKDIAEEIRAIAQAGYWGTVGTEKVQATDEEGNLKFEKVQATDEEGNLKFEKVQATDEEGNPVFDTVFDEETGEEVQKPVMVDVPVMVDAPVMVEKPVAGSLAAMKETLKATGMFTDAELATMTDGMALAATQMALYSKTKDESAADYVYAKWIKALVGTEKVVDEYGNLWATMQAEASKLPSDHADDVAMLFKLYDYLRDLEGVKEEKVVGPENFIADGSLQLQVLGKAEDHENNDDKDKKNDAYVTNLTFALAVTPGEGDSLVVKVMGVDAEGKTKPIAEARIAGENAENENYDYLKADANGNYTFTGITMVENGVEYHISMEGIQNLEGGNVYVFECEATDRPDMIGMASSKNTVNVHSMSFKFDVKDKKDNSGKGGNKQVTVEQTEDEVTIEEIDVPMIEQPEIIEEEEVPMTDLPGFEFDEDPVVDDVEIGDEEVPMADAEVSVIAETGDSNHMTAGFGGMFAALAGMMMLRRKKENE